MANFSEIAARYEKDSIVQKSASDQLLDLIGIAYADDVLDIGCGTGHITRQVAEKTQGKVVGVDASPGMIEEARRSNSDLGITFEVCSADRLPYKDQFDAILCNSAFQWFKKPEAALKSCHTALRPKGRMAIQAPARKVYCPNFIDAVDRITKDPHLGAQFESFESPWFLLETPEEYGKLFEAVGFEVLETRIETVVTSHTPEQVFKVFDSGAAAGYLNQDYYSVAMSDDYVKRFRATVKQAFVDQAKPDGHVDLTFHRIYLLARKP
jgi:ubiquinone/menaquinone biosynthesis C-methylase UbiE